MIEFNRERVELLEELIRTGQLMANYMYAISQTQTEIRNERSIATAKQLQGDWDALRKQFRPSLELLRSAPMAFDPIGMGA